ncbi:MAG: hypothetical protein QNJ53_30600 [Pleurocapsa sp. MO_192.B19]|nr:hypothetical protein [Pleurocapsa sp. MO_192.B19]
MKLTYRDVPYQPQSKSDRSWELSTFFERTLARVLAFGRLIIRIVLNGYQPKIRQGCDRDNNIYWYAYYPLSGISKVLASEAEIKQWLELTQ